MTPETLNLVCQIVTALVVLLTLISNIPGVSKSKAGEVMRKSLAIDVVGLIRLAAPLLTAFSKPKE